MTKFCIISTSLFVMLTIALIRTPEQSQKVPIRTASRAASGVMTPKPNLGRWVSAEFDVSAYCAPCDICCKGANDGVTASGNRVDGPIRHWIAADASFPFGTVFRIPGYNLGRPVVVLDRGGAITGNRLDVYFSTHQAALNWRRRKLTCEYLKGE